MPSLNEMKTYLRADYDDDDEIIKGLIAASKAICEDILRHVKDEEIKNYENFKLATMYTVAYFYENREEANHKDLMLTLRALLSSDRKVGF